MIKKIKNVFYYLQGNIRYQLYYSSDFSFLIPTYIREQIDMRINSMRPICYIKGECDMCGCKTTALQMCNKPCEGNCYPRMMSRNKWVFFKNKNKEKDFGGMILFQNFQYIIWKIKNGEFIGDDAVPFNLKEGVYDYNCLKLKKQ